MTLVEHVRAMARNNAWSNHRLLTACAGLTEEAFAAPRTGFFPSLQATLNHILTVDCFYLDALEGGGMGLSVFDPAIPYPAAAGLVEAQGAVDRRLIAFCDGLADPDGLERVVVIDRGEDGLDRETVGQVLAHLFVHQIHHRGQAHAMLSGTCAEPPQLDEFFLDYDRRRREGELRRLRL
ncbi:damage-inducible protein DinB [Azospirillum sp. RWY-5-1]|uniref:Damage-inducible protein DinB n=1 Tax=Azospirillum oleiclasticum TaxID=2735135 RepID=A0ABX2TBN6_9PROT|nr:DinB family protein [Azospirillum oleiclasticum]NYZ14221.1 damage-inducible protein DinB [Azospirillum oleiclasticum]NYZ21705.1 damage-inducible protein DinB [Azospirillum oleiclasticum]